MNNNKMFKGKGDKGNGHQQGKKKIIKSNNHGSASNNENNKRNDSNDGYGHGKDQRACIDEVLIGKSKVKKINNLQAAATRAGNKSASSRGGLEGYLISVKDPSIRRWLSKNFNTSGNSHNDTKLQQLSKKHENAPVTPARKRSSLARPVRVQDNILQAKECGPAVWNNDEGSARNREADRVADHRHLEHKARVADNVDKLARRVDEEGPSRAADDLVEVYVNREAKAWSIRLRVIEFFDLIVPKYRKQRRRKCHCSLTITTMGQKCINSSVDARPGLRDNHHESAFKDTEHLLKVLSINNVDQDNRYNVLRCSVM